MPGPAPKPEALRQRRNRHSTKATLQTVESAADNAVPQLPNRIGGWHPFVTGWWESIWRSPMASEWLDSDMQGGLYQIAFLHQDFWDADSPAKRLCAAAEIRMQEVRFGLSPIDRRRLQWSVEQGEVAAERTESRRQSKRPPKAGTDPRSVLKVS